MGTQVLGISVNGESTNRGFAQKVGVTFPLLSDTRKTVSKQYGVLNFFRVASRATFVVDAEGFIRHIGRGAAAADPSGAEQACRMLSGPFRPSEGRDTIPAGPMS